MKNGKDQNKSDITVAPTDNIPALKPAFAQAQPLHDYPKNAFAKVGGPDQTGDGTYVLPAWRQRRCTL
jgi:hypothetical protein